MSSHYSRSSAPVLDRLAGVVAAFEAGRADMIEAMLLIDHLVCVAQSGPKTVSGPPGPGGVESAARRALLGCASDRDDVNWAQMVHPGSVVWPVVLELGGPAECSGNEVLTAARAGYEVTQRCAELFVTAERTRFHITATAGIVGAAAAAAVTMRQSPGQVSDALGHALSVMGGSAGSLHERSGTRQFHRAHAVRTGIAAAMAAEDGLHSTREDLDHDWGLLDALDDEQIVALLRQPSSALVTTSVRPFPTSGWNQAVYESAGTAASGLQGRVSTVRVEVDPRVLAASESSPRLADEAWVKVEWAAARAVAASTDQRARDLVGRVHVRSVDRPATKVEVLTTHGSGSAEVSIPLGHPSRPLSSDLLGAKWQLSPAVAESLVLEVAELLGGTAPGAVGRIERTVAQKCFSTDKEAR